MNTYLLQDWQNLAFLLVTGSFALAGRQWGLAGIMSAALLGLVWFYRRPRGVSRVLDQNALVSPCSGHVIDIVKTGSKNRVVIFMSLLDEHVQVAPCDLFVVNVVHSAGKHHPAGWTTKSDLNENVSFSFRSCRGYSFNLLVFAGMLARRIQPLTSSFHLEMRGTPVCVVKLGSRCDFIYDEREFECNFFVGQRLQANEEIGYQK